MPREEGLAMLRYRLGLDKTGWSFLRDRIGGAKREATTSSLLALVLALFLSLAPLLFLASGLKKNSTLLFPTTCLVKMFLNKRNKRFEFLQLRG